MWDLIKHQPWHLTESCVYYVYQEKNSEKHSRKYCNLGKTLSATFVKDFATFFEKGSSLSIKNFALMKGFIFAVYVRKVPFWKAYFKNNNPY